MKKFNCECCGAALPIPDRYQRYVKCEYCSATYEIEVYETQLNPRQDNTITLYDPHYVLIEPGYIQKLCATTTIDEENIRYYPPEVIEKHIRNQLAEQIMEYLIPNLTIEESYDIKNFARKYRTVIRLDTRGY